MKILFLCPGTDIAGLCYGMKRAFDRHAPDWQARSTVRIRSPFGYPTDAPWAQHRYLFQQSDVVHIMDNPINPDAFPKKHRGLVVEHVGSRYRRNPEGMDRLCRAMHATQITAGLDFVGMPWLPPVVDLDHLARIRSELWQPSERVRIVHAPTHRRLKSTDVIESVVARLAQRHPIDFDIVEGVPWQECLARKARADILVDELTHGYGLNALECWAMGMPVVSGIADQALRDRMLSEFGALPFVDATADTLERQLGALIAEPDLRALWGQRGLAHARRFHAEPVVVERALAIYARVA